MINLSITPHELAAARAAVLAADPTETDDSHGVALHVRDGGRRWTAWSHHVLASTTTFDAGTMDDGVALVSRRLVEFGASVSDQGHDVELIIGSDVATVGDGGVALSFQHPSARFVPDAPEPLVIPAASAEIPAP